MAGKVYRINIKGEKAGERGLPKSPVSSALVTAAGVEGDFNRYRQEMAGGDPDMALLLIPLETIAQLQREGWPVEPGDLGENITTIGIEYSSFEAGKSYRVGDEVRIQISRPCEPCKNLYRLPYVGVEKGPWFIRALLGRRGWYARVLAGGLVRAGDPIEAL